jgi:pimeloyl-ACP methyl ester carboxylesterase
MATVTAWQSPTTNSAVRTASPYRDRMLGDLAPTQRRVCAAGVDTAYYESGEGPPLVLLHGGIECGGAYWAPVVPELARRFRVLVPDMPGLGESAPFDKLTADRFAKWFSSFLQIVDAARPIVVSHSLAGYLAQRYAIERGRDLERLVVYGAPGMGKYRMPLRLVYVATRLDLRPTPKNDERFSRFALLDYEPTRARDVDWYDAFSAYSLERMVRPAVKRTMHTLIRSCTKRIPDAELSQITIPVDLLWGEGDRMVPLALASGASTRLGWPLHVIPNAAHVPHIEQPDEFVDTLFSILLPPTAADETLAASSFGSPNGTALSVLEGAAK